MAGSATMPATPAAPIVRNHRVITGPNSRPTRAVPTRWAVNRTTMITSVIGMTSSPRLGSTTRRPSTAESTEIAGVIMLSARKSEAPRIPSTLSTATVRAPERLTRRPPGRVIRVISDMMPPSPLLSARSTRPT